MKIYNVIWEERHSVNIKAKSKEEAVEKLYNGNYDTNGEEAEMSTTPEAYEIK